VIGTLTSTVRRRLTALLACACAVLMPLLKLSGRQRVAALLGCACIASVALVLAPVPTVVRALVVLPVALLVPGLCVIRIVGLREPPIQLAVAFSVSAALWVAVAQAQIYLRLWDPKAGLAVLLLASAASQVPELRGRGRHASWRPR
jgi:hypothetical protein